MARLIYSIFMSLDGYVADENGNFDWAAPDEEVHRFANDLERSVGTHLYGRRMYETMVYWETAHEAPHQPGVVLDYAQIWQQADKVVYSRTLDRPTTRMTRIEREFRPEAVSEMKASADRDISVGGPALASAAIRAGLLDELQLFVAPVVVGRGNAALPPDAALRLELEESRQFANGMVFLRYAIRP